MVVSWAWTNTFIDTTTEGIKVIDTMVWTGFVGTQDIEISPICRIFHFFPGIKKQADTPTGFHYSIIDPNIIEIKADASPERAVIDLLVFGV